MPIDRDVLDAVLDMDEHDLRRVLILARARLEQQGVVFHDGGPKVGLRKQLVRCGKETCTKCPHGPYWYATWREGGERHTRYVGKLDDEPFNPEAVGADAASSGR